MKSSALAARGARHAFASPRAQIEAIVGRRFSEEGDVAAVAELVARSDGVQKTAALATSHAQRAADALAVLPPSAARDAMRSAFMRVPKLMLLLRQQPSVSFGDAVLYGKCVDGAGKPPTRRRQRKASPLLESVRAMALEIHIQ